MSEHKFYPEIPGLVSSKRRYLQEIYVIFLCFSLVSKCDISLAAESVNQNETPWTGISVIQGYPKRYHQGYNWTTTPTTRNPEIDNEIHFLAKRKSQVAPTTFPSLSMDGWKPIEATSSYQNSSVHEKSQQDDPVVVVGKPVETNVGEITLRQSMTFSSAKNSSRLDVPDEAARKSFYVPLNPKYSFLAALLAGTRKLIGFIAFNQLSMNFTNLTFFLYIVAPFVSIVSLWSQKCWSSYGGDLGTCYTA